LGTPSSPASALGSHQVVVVLVPQGNRTAQPYTTRPYITGGRTSNVYTYFYLSIPPTPTPVPAPTSAPPAAVCNCSGLDLDCNNFSTHNQAQACFDYCWSQGYGDVFGLDRDNDGLACEALP
jgi:hypothetical protein